MLQNYFLGKSLAHLLTKEKIIPAEKRRSIVNTIVDFMLETFGNELTYAQKIVTAQSAVIEFPGLEFTDGNPTVKFWSDGFDICMGSIDTSDNCGLYLFK